MEFVFLDLQFWIYHLDHSCIWFFFFSADQPILMYIIDELILDQEVILINHSISIVFYGFTTVSAVQIRSQISRITNCWEPNNNLDEVITTKDRVPVLRAN
jgi:hypothetical protein